jgi:hypothetical protein
MAFPGRACRLIIYRISRQRSWSFTCDPWPLRGSSVVALDADTGKIKWHYQFWPHDEFDYDAVQVPVLADITWQGEPRKVMLWANRNGFFYVPDRVTGKFLLGKLFVEVNWATGFDETGRPMRVAGKVPTSEGTVISRVIRAGPTGIRPPSARARAVLHPFVGKLFIRVYQGQG